MFSLITRNNAAMSEHSASFGGTIWFLGRKQ